MLKVVSSKKDVGVRGVITEESFSFAAHTRPLQQVQECQACIAMSSFNVAFTYAFVWIMRVLLLATCNVM